MADEDRARAIYLRVDEVRRLDHWCESLLKAFEPCTVYLVGSVQDHADWRDVDVRVVVNDERLSGTLLMKLPDLNMLLSQWGQQQTGLPIDCQVQSRTECRAHDGTRNPRGVKRAEARHSKENPRKPVGKRG